MYMLFSACLMSLRHVGRRIWVDSADHAVVQATSWGRVVEEDGVGVVDEDAVGRWGGEHGIYGLKTREEAYLLGASHLVGDAWEAVLCADHAVVRGVEGKFYGLGLLLVKGLFSHQEDRLVETRWEGLEK
jgi:hypothetical protein